MSDLDRFAENVQLSDKDAAAPITSTVDGAKRGVDVFLLNPEEFAAGDASEATLVAVRDQLVLILAQLDDATADTVLSVLKLLLTTIDNGVAVSGNVNVDNFPTTQPVSAASLPLPTGAATEATLDDARDRVRARFGVSQGEPVVCGVGATVLYTPAAGQRVRMKWIGFATTSTDTAIIATLRWQGGDDIYMWPIGAVPAFAHGVVREGAVDEVLEFHLSGTATVYVNIDVEEF